MRNWFINNFVFLKFIRHDRYDSRSTGAMSRNSTMQADRVDSPYATGRTSNATAAAATSLESGVIGVGVSGLGGDAVSAVSNTGINTAAGADAMGRQTNYPSSEYDSDDDTLWLADALSFSEMPKNIPQEVRDSVSAGFNFTNSIVGSSSLTRGNSITGGYGRRASTASNSGGGGGGNSTNGMNGNSGNSSSSGAHAHESAFRPYTDPVMNAIMQQAADAGTGNGGGGGGGGSSAVGTGSGSGKQGGLFLGTKQRNDSVGSSAASSTHSTRSILIAESSNKAIDAKNKRGSRFYPDIDSEKFVRFGGTETRVLSTGGNTPRGSEQSESALAEAERESNNIL